MGCVLLQMDLDHIAAAELCADTGERNYRTLYWQ